MGKGSGRRPGNNYEANWVRIFGKGKEPTPGESLDKIDCNWTMCCHKDCIRCYPNNKNQGKGKEEFGE
jgi:hypothetical protein